MPRQHVWSDREEDGVKREVRASRFGGVWRLQSKRGDEDAWTYHELDRRARIASWRLRALDLEPGETLTVA